MKEKKNNDFVAGILILLLLLLAIRGLSEIIAWKVKMGVDDHSGYSNIKVSDLTSFQKITIGIPISLNRESLEALTALPGIGPKRASFIVRERSKRGGFKHLEELKAVSGIGSALYQKISPYLVL